MSWLLLGFQSVAMALGRGVSPYLPLNLEPEIESQIERVLILANMPVMTRPIAAATVERALTKARKIDPVLCATLSITCFAIRITSESPTQVPKGLRAAARAHTPWTPTDMEWRRTATGTPRHRSTGNRATISWWNAGAVAYQGKTDYTGSMISLGWDFAQLDIGFRPHWLSPMTDSSMLMSTEAATMPSVTLSNYMPLTRFGLHYELFAAKMSASQHIVFNDTLTAGSPASPEFIWMRNRPRAGPLA